MAESTQLVTLPAELESSFINNDYVTNLIDGIRKEASSLIGDLETAKGRSVYVSMAARVRSTKVYIDDAGKALVADLKKRPALIDASRRRIREELDALATEIRAPVTAWEEDQERKKQAEAAKIAAEKLAAKIESDHEIGLLLNDKFDRDAAIEEARLKEAEAQRIQALIEQTRLESEQKAKMEIEASARREAEVRAAQERVVKEAVNAKEKAEHDRLMALENARREKELAIQQERMAAQARENARLAEEKRIADEAAARADDIEYKRSVHRTAVNDLVAIGISDEFAIACVRAIAMNKISKTTINY